MARVALADCGFGYGGKSRFLSGNMQPMAGRDMRPDEIAAAEVVAAYLDARPQPRDVQDAAPATHDFDLLLSDGRRVALEVTTAADPERISQDAAAFSKTWSSPSLAHDWWVVLTRVVVRADAQMRKLMKEIVALLEVMEQHEVTEVNRDWLQTVREAVPSELISAREQLVGRGVSLARSNGPRRTPNGGEVSVSFSNHFRWNSALVNRLVRAAAESNASKLTAAGADERHLFVWVDPSYSAAEAAVTHVPTMTAPPHMPSEIDVVWIATRGFPVFGATPVGGVGVLRVWRCRHSDANWERMPLETLAGSENDH